jgi:sugar phosphate isomerase/epimerase
MLGAKWSGRVTDILDWIAAAGYAGIEITNSMICEFAGRPQAFADELRKRNLALAAFAYSTGSGFTRPERWADDLDGARQAIRFLEHFPRPRLGLGGAASSDPTNPERRLDHALRFYNEVGRIAAEVGVAVNVHPHSHHGSLLETAEQYRYLLERLDAKYVAFGPDTGHIVRGGQGLLTCLRTWLPRIVHLHLKDATADRQWVGLGEGVCDFPAVLALLQAAGYDGWVVAEEESEAARRDGVAAIRRNREYLKTIGY